MVIQSYFRDRYLYENIKIKLKNARMLRNNQIFGGWKKIWKTLLNLSFEEMSILVKYVDSTGGFFYLCILFLTRCIEQCASKFSSNPCILHFVLSLVITNSGKSYV